MGVFSAYCDTCGNDPDECICGITSDFPNDPILELDSDYLDWDHYEEDDDETDG